MPCSPDREACFTTLEKDASLLCVGRQPTSSLLDDRYVLRGGSSFPDLHLWCGFRLCRRVVVEGEEVHQFLVSLLRQGLRALAAQSVCRNWRV